MRTITIRQLDQNLFKELEDLPVTVTRYGKPYCVITGGDVSPGLQIREVTDAEIPSVTPQERPYTKEDWEPTVHKCDAPNCRSMQAVQVRGVGYSDEGEISYTRYLCEAHIKAAKKSGEEITYV